jgi:hypothetical protein
MSPAKPATDPDSGIFIASMAQPCRTFTTSSLKPLPFRFDGRAIYFPHQGSRSCFGIGLEHSSATRYSPANLPPSPTYAPKRPPMRGLLGVKTEP